jgi:hypothetical protein
MKQTFTEDALSGQTVIEQLKRPKYQYIHGDKVDPDLKDDGEPRTDSVSRCLK